MDIVLIRKRSDSVLANKRNVQLMDVKFSELYEL